jgi:hypothetical protein
VNAQGSGVGPGGGSFTVAPNTTTGPRQASVDVAGVRMTIRQAAAPACFGAQLSLPQSVQGALASTDCRLGQPGHPLAPADLYTFTARAGQRVRIELLAAVKASDFDSLPPDQDPPVEALDAFLYLFGPDGSIIAANDDVSGSPHNTDSALPVTGFVLLPQTGVYTIAATSFENNDNGAYTLNLLNNAAASSVALSSSAFSVNEDVGSGLGVDGTGFRVVTPWTTRPRTARPAG